MKGFMSQRIIDYYWLEERFSHTIGRFFFGWLTIVLLYKNSKNCIENRSTVFVYSVWLQFDKVDYILFFFGICRWCQVSTATRKFMICYMASIHSLWSYDFIKLFYYFAGSSDGTTFKRGRLFLGFTVPGHYQQLWTVSNSSGIKCDRERSDYTKSRIRSWSSGMCYMCYNLLRKLNDSLF